VARNFNFTGSVKVFARTAIDHRFLLDDNTGIGLVASFCEDDVHVTGGF
jgi:hypothetical protein